MEKQTAIKYDALLRVFADGKGQDYKPDNLKSMVTKVAFSDNEINTAIAVLRNDKLIKPTYHLEAPGFEMGRFSITEKGIKFLEIQGGYTKNRWSDFYKKNNVRFTFIRHWVWFIFLILSLLFNVYLLLKNN